MSFIPVERAPTPIPEVPQLLPGSSPLPVLLAPPKPPPPSANYKKVEEFVEQLREENTAYIAELQKEAQAIFAKRGPLCDSEGFYQHTGECWNDAFQQILCNSDSFKERIQYELIHKTFDNVAKQLHDLNFVPRWQDPADYIEENWDEIQLMKQWMSLYIHELQKRFLRHYITEGARRNLKEEMCSTGEELGEVALNRIAQLSRTARARKGGVEAQRGAIFGKTNVKERTLQNVLYHKTLNEYKKNVRGGSLGDIQILANVANAIFFPTDEFEFHDYGFSQLEPVVQMASSRVRFEAMLSKTSAIWASFFSTGTGGHAVAFYQCGGSYFLYDDNFGTIEYRWDILFSVLIDMINRGYEPSVKFVKVYIEKESTGESFFYASYPTIEFTEDGKSQNLLLFHKEMIHIPGDAKKFRFEKFGYKVTGKFYERRVFYLDDMCFFLKNSSAITNTGFERNTAARIKGYSIFTYLYYGDEAKAMKALEEMPVKPDLTAREEGGRPPVPVLQIAIEEGMERVAIAIVQKGYDTEYIFEEFPSIVYAMKYNMLNLFRILLEKGTGRDFKDRKGRGLLHFAALNSDPAFVLELLKTGVDINDISRLGRTALIYAAESGNLEVVKALCDAGADASIEDFGNPQLGTPPSTAIEYAKTEAMKEVLKTCGASKGGGKRNTRKSRRRRHRKTRHRIHKN